MEALQAGGQKLPATKKGYRNLRNPCQKKNSLN